MNRKVLLVEPASEERATLRSLLDHVYDVHAAASGAEALELCERHGPYAVAIVDEGVSLDADEGDAVTFLAEVGTLFPAVQRIMMGRSTDPDLPVRALEEGGVFRFLRKPLRPEEFLAAVKTGAERYQRQEKELLLTEQVSFAREALQSMARTLERRLTTETERLRALEEFGIALAGAESLQAVVHRTAELLHRVFEGRTIRVTLADHRTERNPGPGKASLPDESDFVREPAVCGSTKVGEICIEAGARGITHSERRFLRAVVSSASLAAQSKVQSRLYDDARMTTIFSLAQLADNHLPGMANHNDRVSRYCYLIAKQMRFDEEVTEAFLADLKLAASLHDIGKVAVPDSILHKDTPLDEYERDVLRRHAVAGAETLRSALETSGEDRVLRMAYEIALTHHERWDGEGYPRGLKGDAIPLGARITSVADAYDVMTCSSYEQTLEHADAVAEIERESGTQFDPAVVDAFLACAAEINGLRRRMVEEHARDAASARAS